MHLFTAMATQVSPMVMKVFIVAGHLTYIAVRMFVFAARIFCIVLHLYSILVRSLPTDTPPTVITGLVILGTVIALLDFETLDICILNAFMYHTDAYDDLLEASYRPPPEAVLYDPQSDCRLLALPAELRNRIYEYALSPVDTRASDTRPNLVALPGFLRQKQPPSLSLLQSCRQIRYETEDILYNVNQTNILDQNLRKFVRTSRKSRLDAIATIVLATTQPLAVVLDLMREMERLESIEIRIQIGVLMHYTEPRYVFNEIQAQREFLKGQIAELPLLRTIRIVFADPSPLRTSEEVKRLAEETADFQSMLDRRIGVNS